MASTFVKNILFPSWGLYLDEIIVWVKVDTNGELLFPFEGGVHGGRAPYEKCFVGRWNTCSVSENFVKKDPQVKVIVASPREHSQKPRLDCFYNNHFNDVVNDENENFVHDSDTPGSQGLELFARNLRSGWTSWGNGVLHRQGVDCFDFVNLRKVVENEMNLK